MIVIPLNFISSFTSLPTRTTLMLCDTVSTSPRLLFGTGIEVLLTLIPNIPLIPGLPMDVNCLFFCLSLAILLCTCCALTHFCIGNLNVQGRVGPLRLYSSQPVTLDSDSYLRHAVLLGLNHSNLLKGWYSLVGIKN